MQIALGNHGTDGEIAPQGEDNLSKGDRHGVQKLQIRPWLRKCVVGGAIDSFAFTAARVMLWVPCHPSGGESKREREVKPKQAAPVPSHCV